MKDILAAIGAWRLCNMMLDENARLPASARVFRVVMWAGASACVAAVAMLVILKLHKRKGGRGFLPFLKEEVSAPNHSTVIDCDRPMRNGEHPTMKPVELFRYLMENSSKKGDVVFDSFGGSGTTLVAAE